MIALIAIGLWLGVVIGLTVHGWHSAGVEMREISAASDREIRTSMRARRSELERWNRAPAALEQASDPDPDPDPDDL